MGLDICLDTLKSYLIYFSEEDIPDFPDEYEDQVRSYNRLIDIIKNQVHQQTGTHIVFNELAAPNPQDITDIDTLDIQLGSYTEIHHLKRYAAYIQEYSAPPPEPFKARYAINDPVLENVIEQEKALFPHLIDHSDSDGFYIPVDFPDPLWIPSEDIGRKEDSDFMDMISIGSSFQLKEELLKINEFLQVDSSEVINNFDIYFETIQKDRWYTEKWCWSVLYYMAHNSIEHKLSIIFA